MRIVALPTASRIASSVTGRRPTTPFRMPSSSSGLGKAQFDPSRGSMRGLVLTIARHTSIDVIRKRTRRQRTESTYCADATYVTDGPEGATERADEARQVRDALGTLPGEQRRAIEMAYFSGLTRREIAASSTVPMGTVKSRMRLGMKKLALTLAPERLCRTGST